MLLPDQRPARGIDCIHVVGGAGQNGQRFGPAGRIHASHDERLAKRLHPHRLVISLQLPKQADVLGVVDGNFAFVSLPPVALLVETASRPFRSAGGLGVGLKRDRGQPGSCQTEANVCHKRKHLHAGNNINKETMCQNAKGTRRCAASYHGLVHF